nr:MAG TPA: hypothetical protein [Caudoviricetes sp.]
MLFSYKYYSASLTILPKNKFIVCILLTICRLIFCYILGISNNIS